MVGIHDIEVLEALAWLMRNLLDRVAELEGRLPTPASAYLPHADIAARLGRLDRAAAAIDGNAPAIATDPSELVRRMEVLEALHAASAWRDPTAPALGDAQLHGAALRASIAAILEAAPAATAPRVLERLRSTHAAGRLPSVRTVRWHLAHLRGTTAMALPHE
jgi:hypothetical protein